MPKLVLKSTVTGQLFDLDSVLMQGDDEYERTVPAEARGVQALAGVTGLGLPDVATQWLEGAGDGAAYRGRRVLPRDIDLPIYVDGSDREGLKAILARLAAVLAGECEFRIVDDDGTYWYTKVHRVGGGRYVYGEDTTGERDLITVLTLRAGDPFWTSSRMSTAVIKASGAGRGLLNGSLTALKFKSSQAFGDVIFENRGDAPAYPLWEITGPGANFKAVSPLGEILQWNGTLLAGQKLFIDTLTGRVWDSTGANRFTNLGTAPRMWTVPPGISTANVTITTAAAGTPTRVAGSDRTNYVTNPSFESNTAGWTFADFLGNAKTASRVTSDKYFGTVSASVTVDDHVQARFTVAGLTVGKKYYAQARIKIPAATGVNFAGDPSADIRAGTDVTNSAYTSVRGQWVQLICEFTASTTSQLIQVVFHPGTQSVGGTTTGWTYAGLIDAVAVSETDDYFDGSFTDSLTNDYEWTGTAHASTSKMWDIVQAGETTIQPTWRDRKWLVI
ncbi:phage tail family protein [Kribbella sp. NBC_01505]|uniref:carbohydrate binding domain-containing protein n=1 Tax=Kribbella sp. NBC_01505 TaxID=2903580 RepID=UPI0038672F66